MSDEQTKRLIKAYFEKTDAPLMFLTGFFQTPEENFYNSMKVEIDIVRSGRDISIAIQDLGVGARKNEFSKFTNKEFIAPVHLEEIPLNSIDLLKRMAGNNPFADIGFRTAMIQYMLMGMGQIQRKIQRSIELQASQVLQTGKVTLRDKDGNAIFTIDYKPKNAHFPTAGVSWATATGSQKMNDITSLGDVVRTNGKHDPDQIIMGVDAYDNFIKDDEVKSLLDNRGYSIGRIAAMEVRGNGGIYRGTIELKNYKYDIWTYNESYTDPNTGDDTPYWDKAKVGVKSSKARLDGTFGAIPNIGRLLGQNSFNLVPELPTRFTSGVTGVDLFTNIFLSNDGNQITGQVGSRPLLIPTAIDTFGCLDTQLGA